MLNWFQVAEAKRILRSKIFSWQSELPEEDIVVALGVVSEATVDEVGTVSIDTSCAKCNGSGVTTKYILVKDLADIYLSKGAGNKINRIKEIRAKYNLGLKSAKEVDEAYSRLLKELTEISYS